MGEQKMPYAFRKGERVTSDLYGEGEILSIHGSWALVRILSIDTSVRLPLETLVTTFPRGVGEVADPKEQRSQTSRPSQPSQTSQRARQAALGKGAPADLAACRSRVVVECLRQGLPPLGAIRDFTVGDAVQERIRGTIRAAAEGKGSCLVLKAPYGQGKSHWGQFARETGLGCGLMTMHVELDGQQRSLSKTTTAAAVVGELLESARLPDGGDALHDDPGDGFRWVIQRAAREFLCACAGGAAAARVRSSAGALRFLRLETLARLVAQNDGVVEVLERYLTGALGRVDAVREVNGLTGVHVSFPPLRMTWGSVGERRAAQAAVLAEAVRLGMVAGARGAVLVVDEIDHDIPVWERGVGETLGTWLQLVKTLPVVVVLLTPVAIGIEEGLGGNLAIEPFSREEADELVGRTLDAYGRAFPAKAVVSGREELMDALWDCFEEEYGSAGWGPRFFVRAAIEACEIARLRGLGSLEEVEVA